MELQITLKCWQCGDEQHGVVNREIRFAFELAQIANQAGWIGKLDMNRGRALVFCSHGCCDAARNVDGTFKKYPSRICQGMMEGRS